LVFVINLDLLYGRCSFDMSGFRCLLFYSPNIKFYSWTIL
jgi:hypothetical protein